MKTANVDITIEQVVVIGNNGDNDWNSSIEDRVKGLTKKAYGWTKYGGVKLGLVQEKKTDEWSCQACGELQTSNLPSYMFEMCADEFIRICSICQAKKLFHHITSLQVLTEMVRQHRDPLA